MFDLKYKSIGKKFTFGKQQISTEDVTRRWITGGLPIGFMDGLPKPDE